MGFQRCRGHPSCALQVPSIGHLTGWRCRDFLSSATRFDAKLARLGGTGHRREGVRHDGSECLEWECAWFDLLTRIHDLPSEQQDPRLILNEEEEGAIEGDRNGRSWYRS